MKVLFVAAELTPIAKVGGLGDVVQALPKALRRAGVQASIVIPRYSFIDKTALQCVAKDIVVPAAGKNERVTLYKGMLPDSSIPVFFVDNPTYLSTGEGPYFSADAFAGAREELFRFVFFSKAVQILLREKVLSADIVHANDWHTGALVSMLKNSKGAPPTVFTIHNLANQGVWSYEEIVRFIGKETSALFADFQGNCNFMAEGILSAAHVTTVSPTYAKEILTKHFGNGLDRILLKRKRSLGGILNGIDYEFFDPEKDKKIFENFSAKNVDKKSVNKEALSQALGISFGKAPLFGLVSRLTEQKGIDIMIKALKMFAGKHDAKFIFLGTGDKRYEDALLELQSDYPEKISVHIKFDETFAHRIYAASDFFLMPSRFEPCGLGQMIAMRYGSLPIVRATGGLKDTVKNMKTGFVFEKSMDVSLDKAMRQAYKIYTENQKRFINMQKTAMEENFDFIRSAEAYKRLYEKIL